AGRWWNLRGGPLLFYYLGLALAAVAVAFTAWFSRSRLGYQWLAVREDEAAARALGIDVFRAKMAAVLVSSAMPAVGGVFMAFYYNNLFPSRVFDINRSIELILAPGGRRAWHCLRTGGRRLHPDPARRGAHRADRLARHQCAGRQGRVLRCGADG